MSENNGQYWDKVSALPEGKKFRDYNWIKEIGSIKIIEQNDSIKIVTNNWSSDTIARYLDNYTFIVAKNDKVAMIRNSIGHHSDAVIQLNCFSKDTNSVFFDQKYRISSVCVNENDKFYVAAEDSVGQNYFLIHDDSLINNFSIFDNYLACPIYLLNRLRTN